MSNVNPEFYDYLQIQLSPHIDLCNSNDVSKIVFAYVLSSLVNFERRRIIRQTWGANSSNLRVAFIVGQSSDLFLQNMLQSEQTQNGDLIQGNFDDNYRNISYKTLTAWKWLTTNCNMSSIRFVIKIDDDVILNISYLNQVTDHPDVLLQTPIISSFFKPKEKSLDLLTNSFVCNVFSGYSPDKDINSKYYVKDSEYNSQLYGLSIYSDYCFGPGYIMTTDLVQKLYSQSSKVKLFWMEDVYVGILARFASAQFRNLDNKFYFDYNPTTFDAKNQKLTNILFIRNIDTPYDFNTVWDSISE